MRNLIAIFALIMTSASFASTKFAVTSESTGHSFGSAKKSNGLASPSLFLDHAVEKTNLQQASQNYVQECYNFTSNRRGQYSQVAIQHCELMHNAYALKCVKVLSKYPRISDIGVENCQYYENDFAATALKRFVWALDGVSDNAVGLISKVHDQDGLDCISALVKKSSRIADKDVDYCTF